MARDYQITLLAIVALSGLASALAASIKEPLPEAQNLLKLINLVENHQKPDVDEVVAAYRDYVKLYELQTDLASSHGNGASSGESKYELINQVLQTEGLDDIAETLFYPFNGSVPRSSLSANLRTNLLKSIAEMSSQW
ncbi:Hypothetical predicted protein [Olea europaea subsp. europaea]|uniref:Uncharacterized protein n=1 Tax=Olea europaea subsp. europaea TaxID=158383 RepID=A0A8S0Q8W8_OLEEU|nr:Hypothetical predicted protein [Olea europaea subsp. europaea]